MKAIFCVGSFCYISTFKYFDDWKKKAVDKRRLLTVSATGSLAVNVTGVSQFLSFIGKMELQQLSLRVNCHLSCL